MARLSEKQTRAANARPWSASKSKAQGFSRGVAVLFLLLLVPLAIPLYLSNEVQQHLLTTLGKYLPEQIKPYLLVNPEDPTEISKDEKLSPAALLKACETHQYKSEIISLDPLVIYINDFTSSQEADELINIGSPDFADSFISRSRGGNQRAPGRTSTSAPLDMSHPLVSCILSRARTFMGSMLLPHEPFSTPQLVRYFPSQKYDLHTDFWPDHQVMNDGSERLFNRVASFFVFLRDNCTEGYTYFPSVEPSYTSKDNPATDEQLEKWYGEKVARGERDGEPQGVKFKPIKGNAVFWVNINADGEGDRRLLHAGLPVGEGEKIGLNLWPRKFYGRLGEERERKGWSGKWRQ